MSLSRDGFWKAGFWSTTFWADGFWYEKKVRSKSSAYFDYDWAVIGQRVFRQYKNTTRELPIEEILQSPIQEVMDISESYISDLEADIGGLSKELEDLLWLISAEQARKSPEAINHIVKVEKVSKDEAIEMFIETTYEKVKKRIQTEKKALFMILMELL